MSKYQRLTVNGIRQVRGWLAWSTALSCAIGTAGVYFAHNGQAFRQISASPVATVEVDQGDVSLIVTENGVLESSDDDVVRCRVESLQGLPLGAPPPAAPDGPSPSLAARIGGASSAAPLRETVRASVAKALGKAQARIAAPPGSAPRSRAETSSSKVSGLPAPSGSFAFAASDQAVPVETPGSLSRSAIRSFDYLVEPHVPLRSTLPDLGVMATAPHSPLSIISIRDDGSRVKAGDIVCELDASALRDALTVQQLRYAQAKAWVEQATCALEADKIALREYECGVLPKDIELVRQNISIRQIEKEQAVRSLDWSRRAFAKGFRTETQVKADAAILEQAEIALRNAQGMLVQLENFTAKRIIKARRARLESIRADLLSLEWSFRLEQMRLKRIETMVANCTIRAARDGTIVYANPPFSSGTTDNRIREGLIVHSMQPLFRLLDPRHIQVRARINESQVARIRPGLPVMIHLEAFPEQPLEGSVTHIVPVPSTAGSTSPDVRSFFATVRIESGTFDEMTTGLSAEVDFLVETRHDVTRIPLEAVRWVGERSYAATLRSSSDEEWQWRPIALGVTDAEYAEVVSGLEPGDRVVANSESLPEADLLPLTPEPPLDLALEAKAHTR